MALLQELRTRVCRIFVLLPHPWCVRTPIQVDIFLGLPSNPTMAAFLMLVEDRLKLAAPRQQFPRPARSILFFVLAARTKVYGC